MELNPAKGSNLRPSELKKRQRLRRGTAGISLAAEPDNLVEEDLENRDPNPEILAAKSVVVFPKKQRNLPVQMAAPVAPIPRPPQAKLNWALKTGVTFSTQGSLESVKAALSRCQKFSFPEGGGPEGQWLNHYRFPYPSISLGHRQRLAGLLLHRPKRTRHQSEEDAADLEYFQTILGCWRKAFLSLYEGLRVRSGSYFYYFQHDFAALFRNRGRAIDVVLCKCGEGVRMALDKEGIAYECHGQLETAPDEPFELGEAPIGLGEQTDSEGEGESGSPTDEASDDDAVTVEQIRAEISARIKKRRLKKIKKRSQSSGHLIIRDVHGFVDYLLNQKDGKSFVVLPELLAPHPFLYGTFCRNEAVVHGPDLTGTSRLKITGMVLPEAVHAAQLALGPEASLAAEADVRSQILIQLPFE